MTESMFVASLLLESEGTALDFKREQYAFDGASNEVKSELLKDVFAFANSWRRTEACILIGADQTPEGRGRPVGIASHLEDSNLQQFVNSKLNRPLRLAYEAFEHEGLQLGVIRIPVQQRPFFAKSAFGKVQAGVVYYRLGSSTAVADPDEVARMGAAEVRGPEVPVLEAGFADLERLDFVGSMVDVRTHMMNFGKFVARARAEPDFSGLQQPSERELAEYVVARERTREIGFAVRNLSASTTARRVRIELRVTDEPGLFVLGIDEEPRPPGPDGLVVGIRSLSIKRPVEVHHSPDGRTHIEALLGDVQPHATAFSDEAIRLGATRAMSVTLEGRVFADDMSPVAITLSAHLTQEGRELTRADVETARRGR